MRRLGCTLIYLWAFSCLANPHLYPAIENPFSIESQLPCSYALFTRDLAGVFRRLGPLTESGKETYGRIGVLLLAGVSEEMWKNAPPAFGAFRNYFTRFQQRRPLDVPSLERALGFVSATQPAHLVVCLLLAGCDFTNGHGIRYVELTPPAEEGTDEEFRPRPGGAPMRVRPKNPPPRPPVPPPKAPAKKRRTPADGAIPLAPNVLFVRAFETDSLEAALDPAVAVSLSRAAEGRRLRKWREFNQALTGRKKNPLFQKVGQDMKWYSTYREILALQVTLAYVREEPPYEESERAIRERALLLALPYESQLVGLIPQKSLNAHNVFEAFEALSSLIYTHEL